MSRSRFDVRVLFLRGQTELNVRVFEDIGHHPRRDRTLRCLGDLAHQRSVAEKMLQIAVARPGVGTDSLGFAVVVDPPGAAPRDAIEYDESAGSLLSRITRRWRLGSRARGCRQRPWLLALWRSDHKRALRHRYGGASSKARASAASLRWNDDHGAKRPFGRVLDVSHAVQGDRGLAVTGLAEHQRGPARGQHDNVVLAGSSVTSTRTAPGRARLWVAARS